MSRGQTIQVAVPVQADDSAQVVPAQVQDFGTSWRDMRADETIQFAPLEISETTPPPPPDWLTNFLQWLSDVFAPVGGLLVAIGPVLFWLLVALLALAVCYFLYEAYGPGVQRRRRKASSARGEWQPEEGAALELLEEADRLAAAGHYDEATHLLLKRSVGQIAEARPDLVDPCSTARELAAEPRLPETARMAFGRIAVPVEKSLFALIRLTQDDWQGARAAYAEFAQVQGNLAPKAVAA